MKRFRGFEASEFVTIAGDHAVAGPPRRRMYLFAGCGPRGAACPRLRRNPFRSPSAATPLRLLSETTRTSGRSSTSVAKNFRPNSMTASKMHSSWSAAKRGVPCGFAACIAPPLDAPSPVTPMVHAAVVSASGGFACRHTISFSWSQGVRLGRHGHFPRFAPFCTFFTSHVSLLWNHEP